MGNCWGSKDGFELQGKYNRNSNGLSSSSTGLSSKGVSSSLVSASTTGSLATPSHNDAVLFGQPSTSSHLRCFAFSDLKAATRNFRQDNVLGEGGFGSVFKGWLDEQTYTASRPGTGIVVAVKKLNPGSAQGHKEWLTEVHFLGQLLHPNLVRLIGYCGEDEQRLLVYEFMPRGSLENHLFRRGAPIPWAVRMKVAVGAAKGLAFLHNAGVIYRDLKTSNILLDPEYMAKLSDFGLAKEGPTGDNTHVSTNVIGTYGYAAPEYVATGHLTIRSDIYSFGVVLLEILTGRHAFEKSRPLEEQDLVDWARPYLSERRKVYRLMDPRLEGQCSRRGFEIAADLAYTCLHTDAKARPSMKSVVETLEPLISSRESKSSVDHPQRHGHVTTMPATRNGHSPLLSHHQHASPMRR